MCMLTFIESLLKSRKKVCEFKFKAWKRKRWGKIFSQLKDGEKQEENVEHERAGRAKASMRRKRGSHFTVTAEETDPFSVNAPDVLACSQGKEKSRRIPASHRTPNKLREVQKLTVKTERLKKNTEPIRTSLCL